MKFFRFIIILLSLTLAISSFANAEERRRMRKNKSSLYLHTNNIYGEVIKVDDLRNLLNPIQTACDGGAIKEFKIDKSWNKNSYGFDYKCVTSNAIKAASSKVYYTPKVIRQDYKEDYQKFAWYELANNHNVECPTETVLSSFVLKNEKSFNYEYSCIEANICNCKKISTADLIFNEKTINQAEFLPVGNRYDDKLLQQFKLRVKEVGDPKDAVYWYEYTTCELNWRNNELDITNEKNKAELQKFEDKQNERAKDTQEKKNKLIEIQKKNVELEEKKKLILKEIENCKTNLLVASKNAKAAAKAKYDAEVEKGKKIKADLATAKANPELVCPWSS